MMSINWVYPLTGGLLIGLASSLLLLLQGRVFGITGLLNGAFFEKDQNRKWRLAIILGLVVVSWPVYLIAPHFFEYKHAGNLPMMIFAGLLVGFGTRMGSGCTSGHGICGLPRFSMRSFVAVCTFMFTGAITVYVMKHVLG